MTKNKLLILLLFMLSIFLLGCQTSLDKADEAFRTGNLDEAESLYKEVVEKDSQPEAYYGLTRVYRKKMDLE